MQRGVGGPAGVSGMSGTFTDPSLHEVIQDAKYQHLPTAHDVMVDLGAGVGRWVGWGAPAWCSDVCVHAPPCAWLEC
jgi:hypothetical protein